MNNPTIPIINPVQALKSLSDVNNNAPPIKKAIPIIIFFKKNHLHLS